MDVKNKWRQEKQPLFRRPISPGFLRNSDPLIEEATHGPGTPWTELYFRLLGEIAADGAIARQSSSRRDVAATALGAQMRQRPEQVLSCKQQDKLSFFVSTVVSRMLSK